MDGAYTLAAAIGARNLQLVEMLLASGVDINEKCYFDKEEAWPLEMACWSFDPRVSA